MYSKHSQLLNTWHSFFLTTTIQMKAETMLPWKTSAQDFASKLACFCCCSSFLGRREFPHGTFGLHLAYVSTLDPSTNAFIFEVQLLWFDQSNQGSIQRWLNSLRTVPWITQQHHWSCKSMMIPLRMQVLSALLSSGTDRHIVCSFPSSRAKGKKRNI